MWSLALPDLRLHTGCSGSPRAAATATHSPALNPLLKWHLEGFLPSLSPIDSASAAPRVCPRFLLREARPWVPRAVVPGLRAILPGRGLAAVYEAVSDQPLISRQDPGLREWVRRRTTILHALKDVKAS